MLPIESLGLNARQWEFLTDPERFVAATKNSEYRLISESTRRQFVTAADILARLNGSFGEKPVRGVLLADDVGLGKTAVGALVAWVVASAGEGRSVRILAPNDLVMRRWEKELRDQITALQRCAPHLEVGDKRVKIGRVKSLPPYSVQVVKHSYAVQIQNRKTSQGRRRSRSANHRGQTLTCDLLIVDEAHRAKGEGSAFSRALMSQRRYAKRILILTATPFSIDLDELNRMLHLIGAEDVAMRPVRAFKKALDNLYTGSTGRNAEEVATVLAARAQAAVEALAPNVIRHGVEDLPAERTAFGHWEEWAIVVPSARAVEQALIVGMDRAIQLTEGHYASSPRFNVGWLHYDCERKRLKKMLGQLEPPAHEVVRAYLSRIGRLRREAGSHPKMVAVAEQVALTLKQGEKVLLFCDHIATAQELAIFLSERLPYIPPKGVPSIEMWQRAWSVAFAKWDGDENPALRETFMRWLCSDLVRAQTWNWISAGGRLAGTTPQHLALALENGFARSSICARTTLSEAKHLYATLIQSRSSRAVLKAAVNRIDLLPGANGASRILAVCDRPEGYRSKHLFTDRQQPDTAISVFNSPFGPDVLIGTDRLSEGIDLHRYCRHLIHYELDPSPIRTVQRNGRLRRLGGWASAVNQPIRYAYPAFRGTRDYRLVQIMKKRIDSFSLLLGGVQGFEIEQIEDADEAWRNNVIQLARTRLRKAAGLLRARKYA